MGHTVGAGFFAAEGFVAAISAGLEPDGYSSAGIKFADAIAWDIGEKQVAGMDPDGTLGPRESVREALPSDILGDDSVECGVETLDSGRGFINRIWSGAYGMWIGASGCHEQKKAGAETMIPLGTGDIFRKNSS